MTVLIEFKTDVFRTALSCFLTIRGIWVGRDSILVVIPLLCTSVCVSLSWVNGERGHDRAWFVPGECSGPWTLVGLVVIL